MQTLKLSTLVALGSLLLACSGESLAPVAGPARAERAPRAELGPRAVQRAQVAPFACPETTAGGAPVAQPPRAALAEA